MRIFLELVAIYFSIGFSFFTLALLLTKERMKLKIAFVILTTVSIISVILLK